MAATDLHEKCMKKLENTLSQSKKAQRLVDAIEKLGCSIPPSFFFVGLVRVSLSLVALLYRMVTELLINRKLLCARITRQLWRGRLSSTRWFMSWSMLTINVEQR